ncbi:MAG: hypothetical protein KAQ94_07845 [Arcobacteraceae bacterium]|nr:hypothetical protein [Arcobacteraceae bacterium]
MKRLIFGIIILAISIGFSGCTSLKTISTLEPVYSDTGKGNYERFSWCIVDVLENHDSFMMTGLAYNVKIRNYESKAVITAAAKADQNFGVFVININQINETELNIKLQATDYTTYEIQETIKAVNSCFNNVKIKNTK